MLPRIQHDAWETRVTADGSRTLVDARGRACHSRHGAWSEARERYAAPAALPSRAGDAGRVRLLDIGTGVGLNLAAALEALDGSGVALDVVTLEVDESVLDAAAAAGPDPVCAAWHAPVLAALAAARVAPAGPERASFGEGGTLRLLLGDAPRTLAALPPDERFDAVFLDPFAPAEDPGLWEPEFIALVAARMAPGACLTTYTASLRVRTRLAAAGLAVGSGPRVGAKSEGTLASAGGPVPALTPRTTRKLARRLALLRQGVARP
jgi:tRNA 5-methylaminomethyl-2-thiouridine biosynthesis bifunctional protein